MDARHDNRDRAGCPLRSTNQCGASPLGDNDIKLEPYQLGGYLGAPFALTFCGTVLNNKVLSFNIPKLAQSNTVRFIVLLLSDLSSALYSM